MEPKEKTRGYMLTSAGTLIIVLAVLLFGLTTDSGEIDWVSVITAAAGFVMAGTGLYLMFRTRGPRTASRREDGPRGGPDSPGRCWSACSATPTARTTARFLVGLSLRKDEIISRSFSTSQATIRNPSHGGGRFDQPVPLLENPLAMRRRHPRLARLTVWVRRPTSSRTVLWHLFDVV
jgi:hypothetical protein